VFKNRKQANKVCVAAPSETNCNLIKRIKQLQNELDKLEIDKKAIKDKYIQSDMFLEDYRDLIRAVGSINSLKTKHLDVFDDVMFLSNNNDEINKATKEINAIKAELGIK
jgi:hypothetical protein